MRHLLWRLPCDAASKPILFSCVINVGVCLSMHTCTTDALVLAIVCPSFLQPLLYHRIACSKMFLMTDQYLNDMYTFDTTALDWSGPLGTSNDQVPAGRYYHATTLAGNQIYLFGGWSTTGA